MYFEVDVGIAAGKKRDTRHDCRNCGRCDAKSESPLFADLCDLKLRRFHVLEQVGGAVVQQFSGFGQADAWRVRSNKVTFSSASSCFN